MAAQTFAIAAEIVWIDVPDRRMVVLSDEIRILSP